MQTCKFALKTSFMLSSRPTWASTTIELLLMISALSVYHTNTQSSNPPLPILVMLLACLDGSGGSQLYFAAPPFQATRVTPGRFYRINESTQETHTHTQKYNDSTQQLWNDGAYLCPKTFLISVIDTGYAGGRLWVEWWLGLNWTLLSREVAWC